MNWNGVIPAITTDFHDDLSVDHAAVADHSRWLVDHGCRGLVPLGSLGEGATLSFDEKCALMETCVEAVAGRAPIIAGIAALSTHEAIRLARQAEKTGCGGLMVLPPYVYSTDWREMKAHVAAVLQASGLPGMLYNNPSAYKTDFVPEQIAELAAEHTNLEAVKESSGDVRRITAIRQRVGDRLAILVGLDDCIVEGIRAGAVGWIAGLVNAFPAESVALFEAASGGDDALTAALYGWFLPLLRLDTLPKFVQHIKWVQACEGRGRPWVRPPRLPLEGADLELVSTVYQRAAATRPAAARRRA